MSHLGTDMRGYLRKLASDRAGNTLAIVAASTLPMMAVIGGGVDISRAYMTKTELQAACDAGVLAGRRAMALSGEYEEDEKATADRMFNFNFTGRSVAAEGIEFDTDDNDDGQVTGTASTTMPTAVMKIFGKENINLEVECMAELQIGNADIMFVLDTTGSMADSVKWGEPAKIAGLRDAVRDFHRTINQAVNDNRTRIRYGFVPYSSTVNASGLFADANTPMPRSYFANSNSYRTRVADFSTKEYVADTPEEVASGTQTYGSKIKKSQCEDYGDNDYPSNGNNPVTSGSKPSPVTATEYQYQSWTNTEGKGKNAVGTCTRRYVTTRTTYETWWKFTKWIYQDEVMDTSAFKSGSSVNIATDLSSSTMVDTKGDYDIELLAQMQAGTAPNGVQATNVGTTSYSWNGCIEERKTVDEEDFDPVPDDALDLDIDLEPDENDSDTQWRPMWREAAYTYQYKNRNWVWDHPSAACPSTMMLFRTVELSDDPDAVPDWLNTYVNNLTPTGNTYHDIGMIWGGRLTSPTGIFAANVNLDADKISVSKHIIFMTDGIMQPSTSVYSAYGVESYDHRIAPAGEEGDITSRHNSRFSAMCEAVKAQGTTVWVIAFGTSMTSELEDCATSGRAYYSSDSDELRSRFRFIAAQVADLRLGQ